MALHLPQVFEQVIKEAPRRVPLLRHVKPDSILVLVHRMGARKHGQNAGLRHARQGKVFAPIFPEVDYGGRDIRYAISFNPGICTDFFDDAKDPIETVMHELWHIGTKCDGKLRRMRHGKQFNEIVHDLTATYHRNGGLPIEKLARDTLVTTRYWKNRQSPSIAYIRRSFFSRQAAELAKMSWQQNWSDDHIVEKNHRIKTLLPKGYQYGCPEGHKMTAYRKFTRPRSCAECSSKFDKRFLLKLL